MSTDTNPSTKPVAKANPGQIILQWLTYAFWGWTAFFASMLAASIASHYLIASSDDSAALYALAAVVILLPLSIVSDIMYSKREPSKKSGDSSVITIVHAVLFALIAIGGVVSVAFSVVQMIINSGDNSSAQVTLYGGLIVALLYTVVFMRTIRLEKPKWLHKYFVIIMAALIGLIVIISIFGPVNGVIATKNDRLIDNNISTVQNGISNYVSTNNQLPTDLSQLDLTGDAQVLVKANLIQYIPNSKPSTTTEETGYDGVKTLSKITTYFYQLCVDYQKASANNDVYTMYSGVDSGDYSSYISSYYHPAGHYCYKVTASPTYTSAIDKAL